MASKNVLLQMKIEDVLTDILVQTGSDNVIVDTATNKTLTTYLSEIVAKINNIQGSATNETQIKGWISEAISSLINGAPETYDTLKEIADYISNNQSAVEALNSAIGTKVDKEEGKGLSANDFTDVLKNKLDGITANANKTEKSATNGNIKVDGKEVNVYTHPNTAGSKHIPLGGSLGQVLQNNGNGSAEWADHKAVVKSGVSTPNDLVNNELFFKLLS